MTRRDRNLMLVGTLALVAARLALSLYREGPVLVADEIGYLMNARVLAGGVAGQLQLAPFYHGGYPLLLAPIVALTSSPGLGYHLVLALNAVLTASLFPLLYLLLVRCTGVTSRIALGTAFAAALYPSVTILSQVAMSENLLFPLTCAWLIAACELAARPAARWAVLTSLLAGFAYTAHGRMIVVVVLSVALLAWLRARHTLASAPALAGLVVLGGGLGATHLLDGFLVRHNYGGHATSEVGSRLSALGHPSALWGVVENLVGQSWSLLTSTFGLAAIVALTAVGSVRTARQGGAWPVAPVLALLLATGLLVVSSGSFPVRSRADMLIYARYAELAAPPLIALGLSRLLHGSPLLAACDPRGTAWAAGFGAITAFVAIVQAMDGLGKANRWNVASFPFVTSDLGANVIAGAGIVAVAGMAALMVAARRRPWLACLLASALFAAVTGYGFHSTVLAAEDASYPKGWTSPARIATAAGIRTVAYDLDRTGVGAGYPHLGANVYLTQWFLPETRLLLFHSRHARPPATYVLSDPGWGARHPILHAAAVWSSSAGTPATLWRTSSR
jgi:hypothetical protein